MKNSAQYLYLSLATIGLASASLPAQAQELSSGEEASHEMAAFDENIDLKEPSSEAAAAEEFGGNFGDDFDADFAAFATTQKRGARPGNTPRGGQSTTYGNTNYYSKGGQSTTYGNTEYYSKGGQSTSYGNTEYYSKGGQATTYGNTVYYSNGGQATTYGNTVYFSKGGQCTTYGSTQYC